MAGNKDVKTREGGLINPMNTDFELEKFGDWSYFHKPELTEAGIKHGFFTGPAGAEALRDCGKEILLHRFGLKDLIIMGQEHSDKVHIIRNGEKPLTGDGLVIVEKRVGGIINTADCLPIVISDPAHPVAAIIHAGWRGTAKMITKKAVLAMWQLGAMREHTMALLGPSIGPCCYEVQEDVRAVFRSQGFPPSIFVRRGGLFLNLREANAWLLREAGVERIYDMNLCTSCNRPLFHSFRRGDTGKRQINFVSIAG
jgi:hypothetical protein